MSVPPLHGRIVASGNSPITLSKLINRNLPLKPVIDPINPPGIGPEKFIGGETRWVNPWT